MSSTFCQDPRELGWRVIDLGQHPMPGMQVLPRFNFARGDALRSRNMNNCEMHAAVSVKSWPVVMMLWSVFLVLRMALGRRHSTEFWLANLCLPDLCLADGRSILAPHRIAATPV